MSDLPTERVELSPPFSYCGLDVFGPFLLKSGRKEHKRYSLILTCFCSRAVHVEMLDDLSTDAFINGLRCFIALICTKLVRHIRCDQGTNFIGAKNELNTALKEVHAERLTTSRKKMCMEGKMAQSAVLSGAVLVPLEERISSQYYDQTKMAHA